MSSASLQGFLTRANPPPPIELISGSVTATAAAAATAASAASPPARYVSAAAPAAYGVPAAAAKVRLGPVVSIIGYYAPSLPRRAPQGWKMPLLEVISSASNLGVRARDARSCGVLLSFLNEEECPVSAYQVEVLLLPYPHSLLTIISVVCSYSQSRSRSFRGGLRVGGSATHFPRPTPTAIRELALTAGCNVDDLSGIMEA